MQSSGGMRQVFAVEGGRGCRVECKQEARSRKRGRNGKDVPPMRNGGAYPPWEHENDEDWEEEDVQFVSDANRSVSWSASGGGLTIRARNSFPESNKKRDCDGISGRRGIAQPRRQDPYDLWGMDEEIDEFEEDFPARNRGRRNDCLAPPPSRSRYQRQEEFRYMEDSPPSPRSLGPIPPSYRRNYPDERVHERGYPARDLGLKDGLRPLNLRERSSSRRLSPPPSRFDTFERERRRERDCSRRLPAHSSRIDPFERERSRRFSPPSRLDSFEREHLLERNCSRRLSPPQDRFDYFESEPPRERNCSRRLTPPPPSRIRSRDRCDSLDPNGHWEDERRKDRGDDYFRRDASRADVREEDDLPPGFGSHTDRKPEGTPRQPKNDCEERLDPRSCYFCGKVGHLSLNCPTKPDRSERSPKRSKLIEDADATGKTCFTCGQIGHFSFQCPTRASDKAKPGDSLARRGKQCYSCGDYGHVSIACPTNKSGGGKDQASGPRTLRRCYNCYEIGHLVHECPMFSDGDALRNEPAQEDSDAVMYKTKLTDAEKHQYLKENRCFTCGKSGHPYYSCPQSEKRLEYVFFDREYKSSWKMLRNPCWKYKDEQGDVHGPVSLSSLSTRLEEGVVPRDTQVHHMYNGNLQPIALGNLVRISKSSSLVAILGCMPEAASFLGEDMDAESCKTNALAALQTKMHYDIFETTVRWLVISSMNEALQHYKTARKSWGKHRPPPAAEDYLEPDRSGPPHSSDCELSSPDGRARPVHIVSRKDAHRV